MMTIVSTTAQSLPSHLICMSQRPLKKLKISENCLKYKYNARYPAFRHKNMQNWMINNTPRPLFIRL